MTSRAPILIGITGGIGAGKSTLLDAFARRGASSFSADAAVHRLYETPAVVEQIRARWGDDVLAADGGIDRTRIAGIVFDDPTERHWLEQLLHPLVAEAWHAFVDAEQAAATPPEFIVAEVPLLYEAGLEDRYDVVVAITAPRELRVERATRRGTGAARAADRAAAQLPEEEKVRRADFSYVNDGTPSDIDSFVDEVITRLRARGT